MKLLCLIPVLAAAACSQPPPGTRSDQGGEARDSAPVAAPYATQDSNGNAATPAQPAPPKESACRVQDGAVLSNEPLKVVGTEPFWGARIDGRCVTYSTPENQAGTRIWTRYTRSANGEAWTGAYEGRPFELRARKVKSCSDGMSDTIYPIEAELTVAGEDRRGCAELL